MSTFVEYMKLGLIVHYQMDTKRHHDNLDKLCELGNMAGAE